jgi:hypothetical protein
VRLVLDSSVVLCQRRGECVWSYMSDIYIEGRGERGVRLVRHLHRVEGESASGSGVVNYIEGRGECVWSYMPDIYIEGGGVRLVLYVRYLHRGEGECVWSYMSDIYIEGRGVRLAVV